MSDDISYYKLFIHVCIEKYTIRFTHKYNANIRTLMGFWLPQIRIQFFAFVSALEVEHNITDLLSMSLKCKFSHLQLH